MRSDTKNVPESAHKAMEDLKDAGIPLIYATGRCIAELQLIQDKLPTKPDYYILEQGTQITDENYNIIYQDTMTVEDAKTVIDLHKKLREEDPSLQILVYFDGIPYTTSTLEDVPENKRSLVKTVDSFDKLLESRARPTKIMFYKKDSKGYGDMEGLQESIAKNLKKMPLSAVITSTRYCEVFNATSSKGKAIRVIADLSGVDLENTAAIGDSGNDLDMIGAVQKGGGVGIAMGNGMDDLKESSDYATLDIKNNGFALAVNQIIENNRRLC
jgi:Cof subfamily protein (haloacid dehalogenase superfamily)